MLEITTVIQKVYIGTEVLKKKTNLFHIKNLEYFRSNNDTSTIGITSS